MVYPLLDKLDHMVEYDHVVEQLGTSAKRL